jgi:hypothetical protein
MIKFSFNDSDKRLVERLRKKGPSIVAAIRAAVDRSNFEMQSKIVAEKLQGQVLEHRSGKLGGSIRVIAAQVVGTKVAGSVEGAGGPAWYGKLHEYGGSFVGHRLLRRPSHLVTRAGGERVYTGSPYGINFAERSFMRSTLREQQETIVARIKAAVYATVKE